MKADFGPAASIFVVGTLVWHSGAIMVATSFALVRGLLKAQLPAWADLPISPIASTGTDNAIFRVGRSLVARLPKVQRAAGQALREHRWLPLLAANLPLKIPETRALGQPDLGYPWQWSVHTWIAGMSATRDSLDNPDAAQRLARFVSAISAVNASGGPASGTENSQRGVPLIERDVSVRRALKQLHDVPGIETAEAAWDDALSVAQWSGEPKWLHGDLQPSNLIMRGGQLVAVIDFGLMGVGDPACDFMAAWTCFTPASRRIFLTAMGANETDLRRGRGWAVSTALIALAFYRATNAAMAEMAQSTLAEVGSDFSLS